MSEPTSAPERDVADVLVEEGLLSPDDRAYADAHQRATSSPVHRVLSALGMVRTLDIARGNARAWGLPYHDLAADPPQSVFVRRFPLSAMLEHHFVPVQQTPDGALVVAATYKPRPALEAAIRQTWGERPIQYRVTTERDLRDTLMRCFRGELVDAATFDLRERMPRYSAYVTITPRQRTFLVLLGAALIAGLAAAPVATLIAINLAINLLFAASVAFRFVTSFHGAKLETDVSVTADEVAALRDEDLPVYTVLCPMYKEAASVAHLFENMSKLHYPPEKLEILAIMEEDDEETQRAAKAARPPGNVQFIIIPSQPPRTKPKACNLALPFAHGEFLVIFDAEDQPDPDQLKRAIVAFRKGPDHLICLQAALNYYNSRENFLTRMFTLEYSSWFDYMLPGLDRLQLPIPLGGTSNHFKSKALRALGGWDPFNVTEDADLGVRTFAQGWSVGVLNATTYEEAVTRADVWVRQRTRWIKGYMQTALVHLRGPVQLSRRIGVVPGLSFLLLVAGTPAGFLAAPPLWLLNSVWLIWRPDWLAQFFPPPILYLGMFNLLVGYLLAIYLNMLAVFKRRRFDLLPWTLLTPLYWVLHSIAAYRALGQLIRSPHRWEKTEHGISQLLVRSQRTT